MTLTFTVTEQVTYQVQGTGSTPEEAARDAGRRFDVSPDSTTTQLFGGVDERSVFTEGLGNDFTEEFEEGMAEVVDT